MTRGWAASCWSTICGGDSSMRTARRIIQVTDYFKRYIKALAAQRRLLLADWLILLCSLISDGFL